MKKNHSPKLKYYLISTVAIFGAFSNLHAAPAQPVVLDRGPSAEYSAALSGAYAQRLGDPILAAAAFERAWARNSSNVAMFNRSLQAYLSAGDLNNAIRLAKVAPTEAINSDVKYILAIDAFVSNDFGKVQNYLNDVTYGSIRSTYVRHLQAWALVLNGKKDEAIVVMSRTSGNRAIDRNANYSRALIYQFIGDEENAQTAFETAYDSGARSSLGIIAYARFLVENNNSNRAFEILRAAMRDSDSPIAILEAYNELKEPNWRPIPKNRRNGKKYAAQGLGAIAMTIASDTRLGSPMTELAAASRIDPNINMLKTRISEIYFASNLDNMATNILATIPTNSIFGDVASRIRADAIADDSTIEAEAIMSVAAANRPNIMNRFSYASYLLSNEKNQQALDIFTSLLQEVGDKNPIETGADKWLIHFGRGNSLSALNRKSEAIEEYRKALELEPTNAILLNSLGYTMLEANIGLNEALVFLEEATRKEPRSGNIIDSYGWALFKLGRFNEALDKLEYAIALEPNNGEIAEHLGDVYWRTNRPIEARLEWSKAKSIYTKEADKARMDNRITNGLAPISQAIARN